MFQDRDLRATTVSVVKAMSFRGGVFSAIRGLSPNPRLAILRYHAICGPEGYSYAGPGICVSPPAFEQQCAYLRTHYTVLSLPDAVRAIRQGAVLPPNAVALTFDDGYADNLAAARVMHRYGLTGTFYLTAGCLDGELPFWVSEVRELVARIPGPSFTLHVKDEAIRIPCGTDREPAIERVYRLLKSHPIAARESFREQLRALSGVTEVPSPMLTWEQVREMHGLGMTIGAHTLTHPNLPSAGLADATGEIVGSKIRLEREVGAPVTMFSYPNGGAERYYTADLQRVVERAGFHAATTSSAGFAGPSSDLYALERVEVSERLEDLIFRLEVDRFLTRATG